MAYEHSDQATIVEIEGLAALVEILQTAGYATRGPVVRDGAIVPGDLDTVFDLPIGFHDDQAPGRYRLDHGADEAIFGWAVGPQSLKGEFFPAQSTVWEMAGGTGGSQPIHSPKVDDKPVAYIGARPCELAALSILDRVLSGGTYPDLRYRARRNRSFIAVAECGAPSGTCFCSSMGTGPGIGEGFDLAITEIEDSDQRRGASTNGGSHRYLVRPGSDAGRSVLEHLPHRLSVDDDWAARDDLLSGSVVAMGERCDTIGLPELLARNLDHPRWAEVAHRCLACGNCTMVCPTCFCSDIHDVTDLSDGVERTRRWSSCFELSHSHLHGGSVRISTASRYRQWATHKLSTWHDQFGSSGCVGCGRCIAWCPVGIDITEEVRAIRAHDGENSPKSREGSNVE